ncbi:predicted protein [Chaetomium globosum CBS 148.51]|uniref:Uncharacterized protein n=1 Tax=Chaetomium globosum (strain ATCC 6205 / CBS 148.51 / DSM 1962 / NBRC 6347 / NRRL 1970) TaxID=306901 RepID=Q2H6A8_CHAGB|nr:uncharacterized protein CHGG_05807 [Chaetomium globosum CBS 148.51]EAQ89188.1 predicted protein [Chaetomium globosum CBS 148.51]
MMSTELKSAASPSISASALLVSTAPRSNQGDDVPTIRFTNVQDLFDAINGNTGDCFVVTRMHSISNSIKDTGINLSEAAEKKVGYRWVPLHVEHEAMVEFMGRVTLRAAQNPELR